MGGKIGVKRYSRSRAVKVIWWPASYLVGTAEEFHKTLGDNVVVLLALQSQS